MKEFSCQVRKHDSHHLELKTILPVPHEGRGKYDLNFYFFSPAQLHFSKATISVEQVLKHIQTYTRFSSPTIALNGLTDPKCLLSPLTRIHGYLEQLQRGEIVEEKHIIYELQTLVNAYRGEIRDFVDLLEQMVKDGIKGLTRYKSKIQQTIVDAEKLLEAMRALFPQFLNPRISDTTRTALEWADEAMGIITERNAIRLFSICKYEFGLDSLLPELERLVDAENIYRHEKGYQSAYIPEKPHIGETLAYRESILKKWAQSAMYMKSIDSRIPKQIGHLLAGIAAGTAMTFAVLATLYAEKVFARNTGPWALIIIVSYIFKDRIKEILREIFGRLLPRLLADRIYRLIDPATGKDAARSQVIIKYGTDRDQPEAIQKARDMKGNPFYAILPPQNVLHYNRLISLNSRLLRSNHSRLESVTEVTRIRIDDWLKEMDDPEEIQYKLINGERKLVSGNRVYHIHLIASLKEDKKGAQAQLFHYSLIMDRTGILRVEKK